MLIMLILEPLISFGDKHCNGGILSSIRGKNTLSENMFYKIDVD